jgi:glycine cleavage system H protein
VTSAIPESLRYSSEHEWVALDGDVATVGITQHAADQLGDIVHVELPAVGTGVVAERPFGEVESTKSFSDLFAPVSGTVIERNDDLATTSGTVNQDPYGAGWMVRVRLEQGTALDHLMDAAAYRAFVEG